MAPEKKRQLQAQLRKLLREGDALHANATLTTEQQTRATAINTEMDAIARELEPEFERGDFADMRRRLTTPTERPLERGDEDSPESRGVPAIEDRSQYNAWPREEADQFMRCVVGMTTARQLPAGIHRDLAETFMQGPQYRDVPTGQGGGTLDVGGFAVPHTLADSILRRMFSEGQILSRCRQVPVEIGKTVSWPAISESSRKAGEGKRFGGIQVYRTGEAAAATLSKLKLELVNLELKKQTALLYATEEILEDAAQMATLIMELTPQAFTFHQEEEIIRGAGASEMQGILTAPAKISVPKEGTQSADTILAENILQMERRMAPGSMANAVFLCNQNALPQLRSLYVAIGTAGVQLYMPPQGLAAAPFGTILGRPLIVSEHCSTIGDEGDLIFADFSQYLYARKGGLKSAQSIHVKFVEGETAFRFTMRNDGKPWWSQPLAPAQGDDDDDTVSPFITLAERA